MLRHYYKHFRSQGHRPGVALYLARTLNDPIIEWQDPASCGRSTNVIMFGMKEIPPFAIQVSVFVDDSPDISWMGSMGKKQPGAVYVNSDIDRWGNAAGWFLSESGETIENLATFYHANLGYARGPAREKARHSLLEQAEELRAALAGEMTCGILRLEVLASDVRIYEKFLGGVMFSEDNNGRAYLLDTVRELMGEVQREELISGMLQAMEKANNTFAKLGRAQDDLEMLRGASVIELAKETL